MSDRSGITPAAKRAASRRWPHLAAAAAAARASGLSTWYEKILVLRASALTMRYAGRVAALDAVSYEARPGEVLGFLGPNGAGKTTAMRICTGFLQPTGGSVSICGLDVAIDPLAARA